MRDTVTPVHDDRTLWRQAAEATHAGEARSHLAETSVTSGNLDRAERQLDELVENGAPAFVRWPYFEALLWFHGKRAESLADLAALRRLAAHTGQPLTLRDAAFRSYVEHFSRLKPAGSDAVELDAAFGLIDALFEENNSLLATALQAEHFLLEKGIGRAEAAEDPAGAGSLRADGAVDRAAEPTLPRRARAVLLDSTALENNRLVAADTLLRPGAPVEPSEIQAAFDGTDSGCLRLALLQILAASAASSDDLAWLEGIRATSPDEERLLRSMLEN